MGPIQAIDSLRVRGNFSSHADDYDSYASVQKRVVALLRERWWAAVRPAGRLLDIGTGTGALAASLLATIPGRELVVMDIAHGMTRAAAQRLALVLPCDGDARCLPFAAETFSGILSSSVYQWVECLPAAFAEVFRVLVPGGVFALALFGEQTLYELRSSHRLAMAESGRGEASHVQSFPTLDEVSAAIGSSSLVLRDLYRTMEVEYHADVPDLLRQLKKIGASNAAADRPRGFASRRVMQTMMTLYEKGHRCEQGLPASYEVIIAIAEKPA